MRRAVLVLLLLHILVYIAPLGIRPLLVPDETRYAEIPREMLVSGDWVVPRLNGLSYYEKPVLAYWLGAMSIAVFGVGNFAVRFPSALCAALTTLVVGLLAGRFLGRRAGLTAAAVHASSPLVFALGVTNVPDNPLTFFVTAALAAFFLAYREPRPGRQRALLFFCGAACGLAFLTKGFLAFAVPFVTVVPFLLWSRRLTEFLRLGWLPALGAAVVAAPWCVLVALRAESFWSHFFWVEHVQRFFSGQGQHPEPFWFFVPYFLVGALPALAMVFPFLSGWRERLAQDTLPAFALGWLLFPFLFFSFSSGKLGTYILPCFPPFALLTAACVERFIETGDLRRLRAVQRWWALGIGLLTLALAALLVVGRARGGLAGLEAVGETWMWMVPGGTAWIAACLYLGSRARKPAVPFWIYFATPAFFYAAIQFSVLPARFTADKTPGRLLAENESRVAPGTLLVAGRTVSAAVAWYLERNDVAVLGRLEEPGWGVEEGARAEGVIPLSRFVRLAEDAAEDRRHVVLFLRRDLYRQMYEGRLPPPTRRADDRGFLWLEYGRRMP